MKKGRIERNGKINRCNCYYTKPLWTNWQKAENRKRKKKFKMRKHIQHKMLQKRNEKWLQMQPVHIFDFNRCWRLLTTLLLCYFSLSYIYIHSYRFLLSQYDSIIFSFSSDILTLRTSFCRFIFFYAFFLPSNIFGICLFILYFWLFAWIASIFLCFFSSLFGSFTGFRHVCQMHLHYNLIFLGFILLFLFLFVWGLTMFIQKKRRKPKDTYHIACQWIL